MITKFYWDQFGPYRRLIAVRKGGVLNYLHHNHLGSTKAVSGSMATDERFTGQKTQKQGSRGSTKWRG